MDIEVEPLGDGRATLTAPVPWLELILAELGRQVRVFSEQMRTVRAEELAREGEQRAIERQARGDFEREAAAIYDEYQRLRERGIAHREALRQLRAGDGGRSYQAHNITSLTVVIYEESARRRRLALDERARRARELLAQGLSHKAIAEQLGLKKHQVVTALRRGRQSGGGPC
jgi:hypothetical protein